MKVKPLMLMAIAVACGLVAMIGVQQVLQNGKRGKNPNLAKVYVAAQDIASGVLIHKEMLAAREVPKSVVPEGAITDYQDILDRALKVKAYAGEIILEPKLCKKGEVGASSTIPPGYRAFTLEVNNSQSHAGMIQPKDRVDVGFTYECKAGANTAPVRKTRTVMEYVEVFSVDDNRDLDKDSVDGKKASVKSISLLVTPKQFELLGHMQSKGNGNFHLALRNKNDDKTTPMKGVDDGYIDSGAYAALKDMGEIPDKEDTKHNPPPVNISDLNTFLKSFSTPEPPAPAAEKPAEPAAVVAPPPPPVKNTWKITIYGMDEPRVVEVDLDSDNPGAAATTPVNASDRKPVKRPDTKKPAPAKKSA
ncbi:MAG: Flp pilus assembly protein CpaB [Planctomycetales bacterium]